MGLELELPVVVGSWGGVFELVGVDDAGIAGEGVVVLIFCGVEGLAVMVGVG